MELNTRQRRAQEITMFAACTVRAIIARDVALYDASDADEAEYMHRRRLEAEGVDDAWDVVVDIYEEGQAGEFARMWRQSPGVPHDWTPDVYTWEPMSTPAECRGVPELVAR